MNEIEEIKRVDALEALIARTHAELLKMSMPYGQANEAEVVRRIKLAAIDIHNLYRDDPGDLP